MKKYLIEYVNQLWSSYESTQENLMMRTMFTIEREVRHMKKSGEKKKIDV